jgi:hypothetical protein
MKCTVASDHVTISSQVCQECLTNKTGINPVHRRKELLNQTRPIGSGSDQMLSMGLRSSMKYANIMRAKHTFDFSEDMVPALMITRFRWVREILLYFQNQHWKLNQFGLLGEKYVQEHPSLQKCLSAEFDAAANLL